MKRKRGEWWLSGFVLDSEGSLKGPGLGLVGRQVLSFEQDVILPLVLVYTQALF